MSRNKNILRQKFPKIRRVLVKGQTLYQVDARRMEGKQQMGKREYFSTLAPAEAKASKIAEELLAGGTEALIDSVLRNQALAGKAALLPYGKSISDAVAYYRTFLDEELKRSESKTISTLADEWLTACQTGSHRKLKEITISGIRQHAATLKAQWGDNKLMAFTEEDLQTYLDGLPHGQIRKLSILKKAKQFFNYCVSKKYITSNPVQNISIHVPQGRIVIVTPEQAERHIKVVEEKHPAFLLYTVIGLFAGLRPTEVKLLKWENIHLDEAVPQIEVLAETSKTNEDRNVPIEANLLLWLKAYTGEKKGFVTPQKNFMKKTTALHKDLEEKWTEDVYRHSYASYWLAKNMDRAHLAEHMGNSIKIIKRHYKKVIKDSEQVKYWQIKPGFPENVISISDEEMQAIRGAKLAAAVR